MSIITEELRTKKVAKNAIK